MSASEYNSPFSQAVRAAEHDIVMAQKRLEAAKFEEQKANALWDRVKDLTGEELDMLQRYIRYKLGEES